MGKPMVPKLATVSPGVPTRDRIRGSYLSQRKPGCRARRWNSCLLPVDVVVGTLFLVVVLFNAYLGDEDELEALDGARSGVDQRRGLAVTVSIQRV